MKRILSPLVQNKKGASDVESGIKVAIAFFGGVLTLIILGFILIVLSGNLEDPATQALPSLSSGTIYNETTATVVNDTGVVINSTVAKLNELSCTVIRAHNATGSIMPIVAANYTVTASTCRIAYSAIGMVSEGEGLNNTFWNITYSYTYKSSAGRDLVQNVTIASSEFFSNATTWFTLLSIVIIIATILIVLSMTRKTRAEKL